jgi:hypothetical protein
MSTIRSNTCGGGPSIDSKATVGLPPPLAIAKEPLTAPPPAQPPRPQAMASRMAAMAARGAVRRARKCVVMVSLIAPERYR